MNDMGNYLCMSEKTWQNYAKLKKHVGLKLLVAIRNVPELVEGIISSFTMFYPIVAKNKHGFNHGFKR